jgi:hypothetical protein
VTDQGRPPFGLPFFRFQAFIEMSMLRNIRHAMPALTMNNGRGPTLITSALSSATKKAYAMTPSMAPMTPMPIIPILNKPIAPDISTPTSRFLVRARICFMLSP